MQASSADWPGYTQVQAWLRHSLYRFDCPDAHTLGEYQLDLLEPEQRTRVAAHAAGCDECQTELQTLRAYLAESIEVPTSLLQRARRVVATLMAPAPGLAYGGLRGGAASAVRVYETEDVTVTLSAGHGAGTLIGLVMATTSPPEELAGREVRLLPREGAPLQAGLDDIGNFEFVGVPAGAYALEVDLPDSLIVIEELQVH
jgi:hypothetical protein